MAADLSPHRARRDQGPPRPGILATPRDPNPYQHELYSRLAAAGHPVRYLGETTPSRILNLLLMPLELLARRRHGYAILHLHWTFGFVLTGAGRWPWLRRLSRWWFQTVVRVARHLGYRFVWTAHNLLPHGVTFDDDAAAQRFIVEQADLIIAHTFSARREILERWTPRQITVLPIGPIAPAGLERTPPPPGNRPRRILFFGLIEEYKGVEDLLACLAAHPVDLDVDIVGRCREPALAERIRGAAAGLPRVRLRLAFVPDEEVGPLFVAADAVILPYRAITTSAAVTLAAVAGRAMILPDIPGFAELPDAALFRYPPGERGLAEALAAVVAAPDRELRERGEAARTILADISWDHIAERTSAALTELVGAEPA